MTSLHVKICGITIPEQGVAIARLGATALGFICVPHTPRYVTPIHIQSIVNALLEAEDNVQRVKRVGVFVNSAIEDIVQIVQMTGLNAVQLHGQESPECCQILRDTLPEVEIIRALRIRDSHTLDQVNLYAPVVDTVLLDAYHPQLMGGTGHTLNWSLLQSFKPDCAWFLAGGITPDNVLEALEQVRPDGIDLSSGVELSPGRKDLVRVAQLFEQLSRRNSTKSPTLLSEV